MDDGNSSPFWPSHNVEHLAICIWFLDSMQDIKEKFLAFLPLQRITRAAISEAILQFLATTFQHLTCMAKDTMEQATCHQM